MSFRTLIKRPLFRAPCVLGALMRLKSNWSRDVYSFLHLVRRGDHVLDVGGNVGYYAGIFAQLVGPRGRIDGFEPVPATFHALESALRQYPQAAAHQLAITDHEGEVTIYLPGSDSGQASLHTHQGESWSANRTTDFRVPATTLDRWAAKNPRPVDFIKLDVEGAELLALRGASQLVKRDQPLLFLEVWKDCLTDFGYSPCDLAAWLHAHGYDRFVAVDDAITPLKDLAIAWEPCLNRGPHNIIAGNGERHFQRLRWCEHIIR